MTETASNGSTKKIIAIVLAGAVAALAIIGALVPEARQYAGDVTKILLSTIGGVMQ